MVQLIKMEIGRKLKDRNGNVWKIVEKKPDDRYLIVNTESSTSKVCWAGNGDVYTLMPTKEEKAKKLAELIHEELEKDYWGDIPLECFEMVYNEDATSDYMEEWGNSLKEVLVRVVERWEKDEESA